MVNDAKPPIQPRIGSGRHPTADGPSPIATHLCQSISQCVFLPGGHLHSTPHRTTSFHQESRSWLVNPNLQRAPNLQCPLSLDLPLLTNPGVQWGLAVDVPPCCVCRLALQYLGRSMQQRQKRCMDHNNTLHQAGLRNTSALPTVSRRGTSNHPFERCLPTR